MTDITRRMNNSAYSIYKTLSGESFWTGCTDRMRWIAARYYAGVETIDDLRARTQIRPIMREVIFVPELTIGEAETIVRMR